MLEYGKQGHIKTGCPKLSKKIKHKGRKESKSIKAYVAWDDNEISSLSKSESDECSNHALIATHEFEDEEEKVRFETPSCDDNAQNAINILLDECKTLYKTVSTQKKQFVSREEKVNIMPKEFYIEKQNYFEKEK